MTSDDIRLRDRAAGSSTPPASQTMTGTEEQSALVTWDGPEDTANPHNWPSRRKWTAASVVAVFSAISSLSSSILSSSLTAISDEFGLGSGIQVQVVFSIYVLAWGIGPLFLSPLSEIYGRSIVLQAGNLGFVVFNIVCGVSKSAAQLIVFRFLSGLAGSASLAIDDGMLTDMWTLDELGTVVGIYSFGPLLGPAVGPVAGGFITEYSDWRWAFFALAIASGAVGVAGIFAVQETYGPALLYRKAKRLRKETGNARLHAGDFEKPKSFGKTLWKSLIRPLRMMVTQVVIQAFILYISYIYGVLYLFLSTFSELWTKRYHFSISIGSLHYLAFAVGLGIGTQVGSMINDKVYRRFKDRNGGEGAPEFRLPVMIGSSFMVPVGCLWYGWSAQHRLHWIMPDLGVMIFGVGGMLSFQAVQAYILEAYPLHGASAMAAATITRSVAGFAFPIFAPAFYCRLDYGWGNSVLALIAVVLGVPSPIFLYRYGATLRSKSRYSTQRPS